MPHMEGIFINGEKAKFHPEDILDTDASQYTEEIGESVTAYLTEHLTNPSNPPIDTSLTISGAAADAKKTGDEISQLKSDLIQSQVDVIRFESGTFIDPNGDGKLPSAYPSRIRNISPIRTDDLYSITIPSGYQAWFFRYDESMTPLGAIGVWNTDTILIDDIRTSNTHFINFAIKKTSAQTSDISADIPTVQSNTIVVSKADYLKELLNEVKAFIDWSVKTGSMVRASDGQYVSSSPYNSYEYPVYGLSKVYLTPYFTNSTYGYAFYDKSKTFIANSGGTYDVATRTEITVPNGAYYIRFTESTAYSKPKLEADWGLMLETKADIKETKEHSAELYADAYNVTNYIPTDGLAVVGKYYDTNGRLQTASNLSTTGIIEVPVGIKDIYYNAYRNITIPTILFFNASMQIVGTVIATTAPAYGDTSYSGYAEIPSTAKYMEFSMNNTIAGQIVTVRYSKVDNNVARITALETDPLYGKKITCTGDSITAATHSYPGHSYVDQIAQAHGMTVDNKAIWGAVFPTNKTSDGDPRGSIYSTISTMASDADIVIISGGINDAEYYALETYWGSITEDYDDTLDTDTFCGALESICKDALQKWSGKPIIFVFEHRMTLDNTTYGAHFNDVQYPLMVEILQKWGIPYVDLYHDMPSLAQISGYAAAYTANGDGTHPNIEGYAKFYVPRVYSKIKEVMGI